MTGSPFRPFALLPILLISALCTLFSALPLRAAGLPSGFDESDWVTGLSNPTAMDFSPDGRLFVCEQGGKLRVIKNGTLLSTSFATLSVQSTGETGLLGLAFDPNFATNGFVYVYYTLGSTGQNRITRLHASSANPDVADVNAQGKPIEVPILDDIQQTELYHNGGAIHFGPDGMLYAAIGNAHDGSNSQSLQNLSGKLLRIDAAHYPAIQPLNNPFVGTPNAQPLIWAYGLRNPFTFDIDRVTGKIYINDVGESSFEEIDLGTAGANYGFPNCEGFYASSGLGSTQCKSVYTNGQYTDPVLAYGHTTDSFSGGFNCAITGGVFYQGSLFPASYVGGFFYSDYCGGWVKFLQPDGRTVVNFAKGMQSPVDLKVGPDGNLYVLFHGGVVHRIRYTDTGTNHVPVPAASATPSQGAAPLDVTLSAVGTTDADSGDVLTYSWNFGDGSPTASGITVTHRYTVGGVQVAQVTVNDGHGGIASKSVNVTVGTPPAPVITSPAKGTHYHAGDSISYLGSATDAVDGTLPASAFSWMVIFHHLTHTHPFLGPVTGVKNGSFTIPQTGETSGVTWYTVQITVTNSLGISSTTAVDILPITSTMSFQTSPVGLQILLDSIPTTTPMHILGVAGFTRLLDVPTPQTVGGTDYEFVSWSDGGAKAHAINTEVVNTTYTAVFQAITPGTPPPGAPQSPTLSNPTSSSLALSWTAALGSVSGYVIDVSLNSQFSSFVSGYNSKDVGNIFSTTLSALSPNTQYFVRLRAYGPGGIGGNSATTSGSTLASPTGSTPLAPDLSGINHKTFTTRDDVVIPPVAGATGFNWDISAASGQQPATSGQQPVFVNALATGGWQLATGGWQLATGSPVPTTAPRLSLSSFALTPGAYVLQVQATNNAGASPWASAQISVVSADLSTIKVFPNPWKKDKHDGHNITFDNLTANSTVKIFTIAGHLVRELPAGAHSSAPNQSPAAGQQTWDLKNDKGDSVASGIYVYVVTDGSGNKKRGKVAVVR